MRWLRHPGFYWAVSIALGGVFVYASVDKIASPAEFARIVYRYRLAGPTAAIGMVPPNLVAVILPWLELLTGALLITGLWRREAAALAGGMLVVFMIAVGYVLWQGIDVANCGCFSVGGEGRGAGWALMAGDLGLLAASLFVLFVPPRETSTLSTGEPIPAR